MSGPTTIDFAALTDPVPEAEVQAFKTQAKAAGAAWASWQPGQIVGVLIMFPFLLVFGVIGLSFAGDFFNSTLNAQNIVATVAPLLFSLVVVLLITFAVIKGITSTGNRWELWARMDRFARANGMTFSPLDTNPSYAGAIFQLGDARQAVDHLRGAAGRFFDLGNYRYTTGSGKNRSTRTWGFLAFNLDRKLPNMVLDSKSNNSFFGTNLPATFDKGQILSLEGDFDEYFTLYCPKEYERDALYVFTPDLMALLIDEAAPFDVEIIDDWMFVYSSMPFRTGDANVYARLFRIIDTVGAKTLTQTDRYVDERVGDFAANYVAPQGQRLKKGVPVAAIVISIVFGVIWLLPQILDAGN